MDLNVKIRALRLAARMLGGPAKLREALQIPPADAADWLAGTREPPPDVVLRVLDLILDDLDAGGPRLRRLNGEPREG